MFDYTRTIKNIVRQNNLDYITVVTKPKTSFLKTHIILASLEPNVPGTIDVDDEVAAKCGVNFANDLQKTLTSKRRSSLNGLERYIILSGNLYITGAGIARQEIDSEQQLQEALIAINERYSRIESEQDKLKNKLIDSMINSLSILNTLTTLLQQAGVDATIETETGPKTGPAIAIHIANLISKKYTLPRFIEVYIGNIIGRSFSRTSFLHGGVENMDSDRSHAIIFSLPKNIKTLKNKVLNICEMIEKTIAQTDLTDYSSRDPKAYYQYKYYNDESRITRALYEGLTADQLGRIARFFVPYAVMGLAFGYKDLLPQIDKITTEFEHQEWEKRNGAGAGRREDYSKAVVYIPNTILTDFGKAIWVSTAIGKGNHIPKKGDPITYRLQDIDKEFTFNIPDFDASNVSDKGAGTNNEYHNISRQAITNELEKLLNREFVKWESFERCLSESADKNWFYAHLSSELQALADNLNIEYTPSFQALNSVGKVKLGQFTYNNKSAQIVFNIPLKTMFIGNDSGTTTSEVIDAVKKWMSEEVGTAASKPKPKQPRRLRTYQAPEKQAPEFSHSRKKPFPHSAYAGKYEVPGQRMVEVGRGQPFTLYIHSDSKEFPEDIFSGMNLHAKILPPLHEGFLGWIGGYIDANASSIYITEIQSDLMQRTWDMMDEFKSKYSAKTELRDTATKLKELRRELARLHAKQWAPAAEKFTLVQKIQELESGLSRIKEKITRVPRLSDFKQYKSKLENVFKKWVDVFYDNVEEYAKLNNIKKIHIISTNNVYSANAPKTEDTVYYRAYDAVAKMRGATRLNKEWWQYELPIKEERIGKSTHAYIYHRVPNLAVLRSIMRSTLLPSIAGSYGPGIYTSLNKGTNTSYGDIIITLLINLANKFLIFQNDTLCEQIYGQVLPAIEQFKYLGIDAATSDVNAATGYVANPEGTRIKDIKAWSEINGAVYGDIVILYRPSVARLVSYQSGSETKSLGGKRVKSESYFTRKLATILG